ncbi:MAG: acyl-CoA thioesterase [Bacteroidota bacterium]
MDTQLSMSFLAEPTDVNYGGSVHGGQVMKWIDQAGYALAVRYSGGYAVTKFVDNIDFINPIHIGDLVIIDAEVISSGKTSIKIKVEVTSEKLISRSLAKNCNCTIVFVAVDSLGNKRNL